MASWACSPWPLAGSPRQAVEPLSAAIWLQPYPNSIPRRHPPARSVSMLCRRTPLACSVGMPCRPAVWACPVDTLLQHVAFGSMERRHASSSMLPLAIAPSARPGRHGPAGLPRRRALSAGPAAISHPSAHPLLCPIDHGAPWGSVSRARSKHIPRTSAGRRAALRPGARSRLAPHTSASPTARLAPRAGSCRYSL